MEAETTPLGASARRGSAEAPARRTLVYGHRLGGQNGPECSRAALERTLSDGVDGLEADVVLTSDQEIVACHDPLLEISTADRSGWAHEHTLRELTRAHLLDARGEPSDETLMSLRELITATPADLPVQLDVKAYADPGLAARAAQRCCEIARELGARERVEIISFFSAACGVATERGFEARLTVWADYDPRALARWAIDHGASGLALEGFILGPQLHKAIREAGLGLSVGVVNSVDQLLRILPFEPEIIVSDCPHEVGAALAEIGEASAEGA